VTAVRPVRSGERGFEVALEASLRAAARRGAGPGKILGADLHRKIRRRWRYPLIVFLVDASESMGEGAVARMAAAKGAVLALLRAAYVERCRVALVAFHGERSEVLLPPTRSIALARERLRRLPVGGATPLADGLWSAWRLIRRERARFPGARPLLVVISDGEANVPLKPGRKVMEEVLDIAARMSGEGIPALVIDSRPPDARHQEMARLARAFGGEVRHLERPRSSQVLELLREKGLPQA
jgi:magnesium chelatase subunit D